MSTSFEARLFTVGELQSDEKVLVVPAYQRPFCWTDKQIEVLVQDLITHFARYSKDKTCRYSLGTVVCHQREALEVLDGQQRLTSIDIILAILDQRKAHADDSEYTVREDDFGWRPSVIRQYENLTQDIRPKISQAILSSVCLKINGAAKDGLIFSDEEGLTPFEKFADCIRKSVCVLRVILPIDDANPYEGPAKFEIVNMRGQALRSIDIAKATLVECLKDANDAERIAFDRLWSGIAALLRSDPQLRVEDIVKNMSDVLGGSSKVSRTDRREGGTKFFEIVGNAFNSKTKLQDQSETDAELTESSEERRFVVDFENLFVIANEVFRSLKGADDEKFETLNIRPRPGESDYRGLHDRIVVGKDVKNENAKLDDQERRKDVWSFMTILWIAAMVARQADELLAAESKNKSPFALLLDTFYAANGYQYSGQYWLLSLVHTAVQDLCPVNCLPKSAQALLSGASSAQELADKVKKSFGKGKGFKHGYLRLILWGLQRFTNPNAAGKMTANMLKLGAGIDEAKLVDAVKNAFMSVGQCDKPDETFVAWRYTENGVRWKLFFTDWLLWVDSMQKGKCFSYLAQALAHPQHAERIAALNVEKSDADQLDHFRKLFAERVNTMRIVSRSQIEHWIARETPSIKDRTVLDHFSNLALINASENVENSNKTTDQKATQLYDNPSAKLLWLASYARATANQQAQLAKRLCTVETDRFWADYIASFAKHDWLGS